MTSTNGRNVRVNSNSAHFEEANSALPFLSLWGKVACGISLLLVRRDWREDVSVTQKEIQPKPNVQNRQRLFVKAQRRGTKGRQMGGRLEMEEPREEKNINDSSVNALLSS